jgi:calcineurin-like phosphoesterase family protein
MHIYDISSIEWRPEFPNLDLYAVNLIDSWNAFTDPKDIVIIVGDVGHYCPRTIEVLKRLNGIKILIIGNHDLTWGDNIYTCGVFSGIHQSIDQNNIHVQHIPEKYAGDCQFYIHGHHHRYNMPGMYKALSQYANDTYRLNCAADLNGNHPCTIQELMLNKEVLLYKYHEMGLLQEES